MIRRFPWFAALSLFAIVSCNSAGNSGETEDTVVSDAPKWDFGIALWTFHTVDFPTSLAQVDSCGYSTQISFSAQPVSAAFEGTASRCFCCSNNSA